MAGRPCKIWSDDMGESEFFLLQSFVEVAKMRIYVSFMCPCLVLSESTTTASSVYASGANSPLSTSPHCSKTPNTPPQLNIFNHEEENECLKAWWHLHVYDSGGLVILLWRWSTFFLLLDTILSHHAVWNFQALMSQEICVLRNLMSRSYLLQSEKWFYIANHKRELTVLTHLTP